MNAFDLSLCEQEPIHIPGYIQPHGYAVSFDSQSLEITGLSVNIENGAKHIGTIIRLWLSDTIITDVLEWFASSDQTKKIFYKQRLNFFDPNEVDLYFYRSHNEIVMECILSVPEEILQCSHIQLSESIQKISSQNSVLEMCEQVANQMRLISGYDRVMVYRFDEEYNGCVIAEAKDEQLQPYLNLNYPASDIPPQARELYRKNLIRCIIDIDYTPVDFIHSNVVQIPLDMTYSYLRSVSPIHLEYLRNMGVKATMTVSILIGEKLWGLIAAHHHSPIQHPLRQVSLIESFGKIFASLLKTKLDNDNRLRQGELHFKLENIINTIQTDRSALTLLNILSQQHKNFHSLFDSDGFILFSENHPISTENQRGDTEIHLVLEILKPFIQNGHFATSHLAFIVPKLDETLLQKYAGIFIIETMSVNSPIYWIWFRYEKPKKLAWGGNPNEKGSINPKGGISPRTSFEAFQEIVRFKSDPWNKAELEFVPTFLIFINQLMEWDNSRQTVAAQKSILSAMEEEKSLHTKQLLESLVDLIEQRDAYTAGHTRRVALYCDLIAKTLDCTIDERRLLYEASVLHDIGKVVVPDAILLKPGRLDLSEYELIKQHVNTGFQILNKINYYQPLAQIIYYHHEKYDGSGYPHGLMGDDIPFLSQIMMVGDAIDAMTSNRIYQPRRSMQEALGEIDTYKGKWYHPKVVDAALSALKTHGGDDFATQVPITSIERARFAYFFKDQLTGAHNETYLEMILKNEIPETSYSHFVLIEIKGMTDYNSLHGWHSGDRLIQAIAEEIALTHREIFRIFGDDFIIGFHSIFDAKMWINEHPLSCKEIEFHYSVLSSDALQKKILN